MFHIDTTCYSGRPADSAGRCAAELACYDLLDELGISYGRVDHDAAATIEICEAIEQYLGAEICKNLFLCNRQRTQFYLLMLRGDKVFKTKDLSHQLGCARLSFASGEDMQRLLGLQPGSVSVLGLMHDHDNLVQLVIDQTVANQPLWGCHPCINTTTLRLQGSELLEKFLPAVHHSPIFVDLPEESNE